MNIERLKNDKASILCFSIMIIFALICTLKMADFCLSGGILNPDVALYAITGLKYAGIDFYNIVNPEDIFFSPIISFLTSLLFRLGLVDISAIIIVTSILGFLGFVGLYFLLRIRFNSLLSLIGVIIFGSTSVVIFSLSKGMIDIPALTASIWVLYFGIKAVDENPKYFLIAFPLLVIGFFIKYVVGFTLPVLFAYYLMNRNVVDVFDSLINDRSLFKQKLIDYVTSKEFKYIIISIVISLILAIIICKTLILDFNGSLIFIEQTADSFNGNNKVSTSNIFNPDKSFYIDNFSEFLFQKQEFGSVLSGLLYFIFTLGIVVNLLNIVINSMFIESKRESFKTRHLDKILIILFIICSIVSFYGFKVLENNMVANIPFLCAIIILFSILNKFPCDKKKLSLNLSFVSYFMIYLLFVSLYPDKTFRYALPLLIPFIYGIVWALDSIFAFLTDGFENNETFVSKINSNIKYSNFSKVISIILICLFVFSTFSFMLPMEFNRSNEIYQEVLYCGFSNDLDDACDYIMNTDSDYHSKSFASFYHSSRIIRWNMNVNVTSLDVKDPNVTEFNDSDYLILYQDLNMDNYHKIHDSGDFHIYYHN